MGGFVGCPLLFTTMVKTGTQVAMYMGFTLGYAHTEVALRHALVIHGRCQPMSQSTVNNRQTTCV